MHGIGHPAAGASGEHVSGSRQQSRPNNAFKTAHDTFGSLGGLTLALAPGMFVPRLLTPSPWIWVIVACSCAPSSHESVEAVRAAIQSQIDRCVEATRVKDIDAYMDCISSDWELKSESGAASSRDELRANALRDWSIIPRTLAIQTKVDSMEVHGLEATVYTSQRWERLMLERDGKTVDTVLTTQKHRETWRKTDRGWVGYKVVELGGEVWVNGKPYEQ